MGEKGKILAFERPDLLKEWDFEKNKDIIAPDIATCGSKTKVWWICPKGHSYDMQIYHRTHGHGCRYCAGQKPIVGENDLETLRPDLLSDWDYEKNAIICRPCDVMPKSNIKVWWKCSKCGYNWFTKIESRANSKYGCTVCARQNYRKKISQKNLIEGTNDIQTLRPDLIVEWDFEENSRLGLFPDKFTVASHQKVHWICRVCNHKWTTRIENRAISNQGCPKCGKQYQTSFPEQVIYYYCQKQFCDTINGFRSEWLGKTEIDIYIPSLKLGIEYDGARFHKSVEQDIEKTKLLKKHNIDLIRVREINCPNIDDDSFHIFTDKRHQNLDDIVNNIFSYISKKYSIEMAVKPDINADIVAIKENYYRELKNNSLLALYPELCDEWDKEKNGMLSPSMFSPGSRQKVYWKCKKCGYVWHTTVSDRVGKKSGCPKCAGRIVISGENDLATLRPDIILDWDYQKNEEIGIIPNSLSCGSHKKVYWKCHICGYEWVTDIHSRTGQNSGCKKCGYKIVSQKRSKKVQCIETGIIYSSATEVYQLLKIDNSKIGKACKTGITAGGFHWKYIE